MSFRAPGSEERVLVQRRRHNIPGLQEARTVIQGGAGQTKPESAQPDPDIAPPNHEAGWDNHIRFIKRFIIIGFGCAILIDIYVISQLSSVLDVA